MLMSKPYQIFAKKFKESNLQFLFEKKISKTRAVGRDGVRANQFAGHVAQEVELISKKVAKGTYKFTKYREKLISKGAFRPPRMLSIPTVRDRIALRALCDFLAEVYPDAVTRKPHEYIKSIKGDLKACGPNAAFLRVDVRDYYPSVDREILVGYIRKRIKKAEALSLIENALSTPTLRSDEGGIPQGLSISNVLANVYLQDLDAKLKKHLRYYRYVDDILVICKSSSHAKEIFEEIKWRLKQERRLECHELSDSGKSCIRSIDQGVDYLGFHLARSKISVRDTSLKKMVGSIISLFSKFRNVQNDTKLLWLLNLRVTGCRLEGKNYGWLFFFLQTEDLRQLARLDRLVRKQITDGGRSHLLGRQKTFIKAYHEIRYNNEATKYIPNFDNIDTDYMIDVISTLTGKAKVEVEAKGEKFIRSEFYKMIRKEVSVLERDILESFS